MFCDQMRELKFCNGYLSLLYFCAGPCTVKSWVLTCASKWNRLVLATIRYSKIPISDASSWLTAHTCSFVFKKVPPLWKGIKIDFFFTRCIKYCCIFKDVMRRFIVLVCLLTGSYATAIDESVGGTYNANESILRISALKVFIDSLGLPVHCKCFAYNFYRFYSWSTFPL